LFRSIIIEDQAYNHSIKMPIYEFKEKSLLLFKRIKKAKGSSFSVSEIEDFLNSIEYDSLKSRSTNKSDIRIVVHDFNTGMKPMLGFSIKSRLGKPPTLFNAGKTTNLVYRILGNVSEEDLQEINNITENNYTLKFEKVSNEMFNLNLQVIDSKMPEILSELIMHYFSGKGSKVSDLLQLIKRGNPIRFDDSLGHNFYEYKIKAFL